ncbi:fumarylacetoacetase [Colletotrichum truncatum]|uniref:Fumarylacetoacetase n=1 Tax=Colletotrichum truncatum TaxID=5467 RepID=A0ACC3YF86_COLTU|nr:fumarylacetoacetase [Colletotrichum truncatum]KAF6788230.1 fumarylacetoacetase [Colletotrichum truncatum]
MKSWLPIPARSHFSLRNIPFGVISTKDNQLHRPAVAIGDHILDLDAFATGGGFHHASSILPEHLKVFSQPTLNSFAELGRPIHRLVRSYLQEVFQENTPHPDVLKENEALRKAALRPASEVSLHLPLSIGDYTDFFAGRNHAHNVGTLFRGPANALNPNYNHLPVAYHGRASSVVVSGTPLRRPWGQALPAPGATEPVFRPCARLDIELEMGMFVSRPNSLGSPIPIKDAEEYIFGYVLMNDWSARDIQQWEYVPLGPFNAKNFGTTISPWVVLADALEPFRTQGLENDTPLQSYLREERPDKVFDIKLQVSLSASGDEETVLTNTSSKNLLWSWPQMVAHHSISGCNLRAGDLLGSGTISGFEPGTQGSLLEQSQGGKVPIKLNGGKERKFLEDGDTVIIRGWAGKQDGEIVGFGECSGQILPSVPL